MADYRIYLAGKVSDSKWTIPEWVQRQAEMVYIGHPAKHPNTFAFLASDHGESHSRDAELFDGYNFFGGNPVAIKSAVLDKIASCEYLCAYIDTADCYGTIAEIAYAYALGKQVYVFLEFDDSTKEAMGDAYRLVVNFPGIESIRVHAPETAAMVLYTLIQCESPIEYSFASGLLYDKLTKRMPVPQLWIGDFRVDFGYTNEMIAIELDGHDYHSTKEQRGYDAKRDRFLQAQGWKVLRFTGSEVWKDTHAVVDEVNTLINNLILEETDGKALAQAVD